MSDGVLLEHKPSLKLSWLRCSAREHWLRLAIGLWIGFAIALTVKGYVTPTYRSTYPAFAAGARDFWQGETEYGSEGYYYGPTFALAFTPFALLPDSIGATLWNWLNLGVFLYATHRFFRDFIATRFPQTYEGLFLVLLLIGSARSLWSAQSNAILIGCVLLAVVEILHKRWWRAALCLAIPVHIKIWPIAIAALLIVQYPKRLLGRFIAMLGLLAALPLLTHSPSYVAYYYHTWKNTLLTRQTQAIRWGGYRDAWTLWETMVGNVDKHVFSAVGLLMAAVVLTWSLAMHWQVSDKRRVLMTTIGLWASWQMLFGPGSERLTLIILAPTTVALVCYCYQEQRGRLMATIGAILAFVIGTGEVERRLLPIWPEAMAVLPIGVVAIVVATIWPHAMFRRLILGMRATRTALTAWRTSPEM